MRIRRILTMLLLIILSALTFGKVYSKGSDGRKVVALTFDDGPDKYDTPKLLEFLKEQNIKATFFLLGQNVENYPQIAHQIKNDGHLIANHTYSHPNFAKMSKEQIEENLLHGAAVIRKVLGVETHIYRPPYGVLTKAELVAAQEIGEVPVIWDVDTLDWSSKSTVDTIIANVEKNVHPGSIILMHTLPKNYKSLAALQTLVPYLRDRGYEFVTIDNLLHIKE